MIVEPAIGVSQAGGSGGKPSLPQPPRTAKASARRLISVDDKTITPRAAVRTDMASFVAARAKRDGNGFAYFVDRGAGVQRGAQYPSVSRGDRPGHGAYR